MLSYTFYFYLFLFLLLYIIKPCSGAPELPGPGYFVLTSTTRRFPSFYHGGCDWLCVPVCYPGDLHRVHRASRPMTLNAISRRGWIDGCFRHQLTYYFICLFHFIYFITQNRITISDLFRLIKQIFSKYSAWVCKSLAAYNILYYYVTL